MYVYMRELCSGDVLVFFEGVIHNLRGQRRGRGTLTYTGWPLSNGPLKVVIDNILSYHSKCLKDSNGSLHS